MVLVGPAGPIPPAATFDLAVWLSRPAVTRGAQFGLTFDPGKVQITGIDEGDYYRSWASRNGASSVVLPQFQIDAPRGRVSTSAVAILGGTGAGPYVAGPTGSGVLATVHCAAASGASGSTSITLQEVVVSEPSDAGSRSAPSVQVTDVTLVVGNAGGAAAPIVTPTPHVVTQPPPSTRAPSSIEVTPAAPVFGVVVDRSLRVLDVQRGGAQPKPPASSTTTSFTGSTESWLPRAPTRSASFGKVVPASSTRLWFAEAGRISRYPRLSRIRRTRQDNRPP
jgi:hypothetical protein